MGRRSTTTIRATSISSRWREALRRRQHAHPGRHRRRRCAGEEGQRDRRACAHQHDVGLHGGADLPDAAGEALDRSHLAERRRGAAGGRHRHARRRRMASVPAATSIAPRVLNHAKLAYNAVAAWLDGEAPAPEKLGSGRRARREAPPAGPCRAGAAGPSGARRVRCGSRRSRRGRSSKATRWSTCGPTSATAPRS